MLSGRIHADQWNALLLCGSDFEQLPACLRRMSGDYCDHAVTGLNARPAAIAPIGGPWIFDGHIDPGKRRPMVSHLTDQVIACPLVLDRKRYKYAMMLRHPKPLPEKRNLTSEDIHLRLQRR